MYVKPKEASQYYNVSENTLRRWSGQGKSNTSQPKEVID